MDLRKLKKLIDLVEDSGIAELEITEGEEKVRISRYGQRAANDALRTATADDGRTGPGQPARRGSGCSRRNRPSPKATW